ncbi:MAG: tetratricopeptide repeat protein [Gammaproteobacteria bacterium]|nr:tetratricopeptide repeat protein [Gammaproteobacteria bacterium]
MSGGFFSELGKRKVFQAAAIYGAVAWGVTEVVVTVVEQLFLPQWVSTLTVIGFVVGFPVAMFLAWTFDITSDGIRRTEIHSRRGTASIAASLILLVAGTTGLFFLIKPSLQLAEHASAATEIPPNSIAVLPFDHSGLPPDEVYLGDGLGDELRDQLGRVEGLRIAARSSSIAALALAVDARARAERLGVARLLEGSMRRQGGDLRLSVQLVDGASGLAVWTETFERSPRELLSLQQEIVGKVIRHMLPDASLMPIEPATHNANANELMMIARHYEQQVRSRVEVDTALLRKAVERYRRATELDPESALAHSRLAGALLYLGEIEAAEAPIFRALSLDPDLSEVQHTMGLYYYAMGEPAAVTAFKRAVELNPNNADALESYAFTLWINRNDENIAELFRRALALDPLSLPRYGALGELLGKEGKFNEVYELIGRIDELFDGPDALRLISRLYELTGDIDRAIAWGIRARDAEPENPDHAGWLAELYAEIDDFEAVLQLTPQPGVGILHVMRRYEDVIDRAEELMIEEPDDIELRYLLAFAYNATGRFESAVWILSSTGLPEIVMELPRSGTDWEGFFTLVNAIHGTGDHELAADLAAWWAGDPRHHDNPDWFVEVYRGCLLGLIGRDGEAVEMLERARRSPRIPVRAVLEDMPCFQRFKDHPEYRATVEHFDERRKELRKRLPITLAEFGVAL